jgi:hypothetical protein
VPLDCGRRILGHWADATRFNAYFAPFFTAAAAQAQLREAGLWTAADEAAVRRPASGADPRRQTDL